MNIYIRVTHNMKSISKMWL